MKRYIFALKYEVDEDYNTNILVDSFMEVKSYSNLKEKYVKRNMCPHTTVKKLSVVYDNDQELVKNDCGIDKSDIDNDVDSMVAMEMRVRYNGGNMSGLYCVYTEEDINAEFLDCIIRTHKANSTLKEFLKEAEL